MHHPAGPRLGLEGGKGSAGKALSSVSRIGGQRQQFGLFPDRPAKGECARIPHGKDMRTVQERRELRC